MHPVELLSIFESGSLEVGVSGFPLVRVDAESKSVDIETKGVKESGIKLSSIIQLEEGRRKNTLTGLLKGSEETAKALSKMGWNLSLYDRGDRILTMGYGVSRLTGRIRFSPLKLRRILAALF